MHFSIGNVLGKEREKKRETEGWRMGGLGELDKYCTSFRIIIYLV